MRQSPNVFLQVEHLKKKVKSGDSDLTILEDVNLTIKTGESVAILGASGSGKTTLLTLLSGLDLPTEGNIYFQDYHLNQLNEEERAILRGRLVGFVFQSFQLLPTLTALENVMLPLEIQYLPYEQCKIEATEWLEKVGLGARLHHYPAQLAGGEQQRVAIARAFVTKPKIVFADEMTGNLDTHTGNFVMDSLFELNEQEKTTLVLVTHDAALSSHCRKRYHLHDGVLTAC